MNKVSNLRKLRKTLWHLRHGGIKQLKAHQQRVAASSGSTSSLASVSRSGKLNLQPWDVPEGALRRADLNVAVILDEFSTLAWQYEWNQIPITPVGWRQAFRQSRIDLLFVESAWRGNDARWQYMLTGPSAPGTALKELLEYCAQHEIPTVFWNKEDPVHFEDFIDSAKLFDFVFTTDEDMLENYSEALNSTSVGVLPFAAQPAIHNPVRPLQGFHSRDVAFGGMYFSHRHASRREQIELLLGAAHDVSSRMAYGLEIYSRFHDLDEKYRFPAPLDEHVRGSLSYLQMLSAYRLHKVFLNVNTVSGSKSMCARRIFEITACGTPVVSTTSPAIQEFFPNGGVVEVSNREEAGHVLRGLVNNTELGDRLVHRAQREIWAKHTYEMRANSVLSQVGLQNHVTRDPSVSIMLSTNRPQQLDHALGMASRQNGVQSEILLLTHGFEPKDDELKFLKDKHSLENLVLITGEEELTLGECLNKLVEAASGDIVAKFDDDDLYGPWYLFDQIQALRFSEAQVVGKQARYIFLEGSEMLVLRNSGNEHMFTDFIAGPTIVTSKELAMETRFERRSLGEDTAFLRRISDMGGKIYAADRFNFIQYRRAHSDAPESKHTWQASDWELLATSEFSTAGFTPKQVLV